MKKDLTEEFAQVQYRKTLSGEDALKVRIGGGPGLPMQPVVDIAGFPYYLNVRWNLLQPHIIMGERKVRPAINLQKDCYYDDQSDKFLMYYHTKKQEPFDVPEGLTALPKHVVFVKLPNTYEADPVGMAREDGFQDPRHYLEKFPIKMYHTAEIIELKNSPLMEEIKANRQQHRQNRSPRKIADPGTKAKHKR